MNSSTVGVPEIVETLINAGASANIRASEGKLKDKKPGDILEGTDEARCERLY